VWIIKKLGLRRNWKEGRRKAHDFQVQEALDQRATKGLVLGILEREAAGKMCYRKKGGDRKAALITAGKKAIPRGLSVTPIRGIRGGGAPESGV